MTARKFICGFLINSTLATVFSVAFTHAKRLQALARDGRLKTPLLIGIDAIHGNALVRGTTVYPAPLGLAATFDEDLVGSVTTPVKELKSFQRIALQPGEKKTVELIIAHEQLALINAAMKRVFEPGDFEVLVGDLKQRFKAL